MLLQWRHPWELLYFYLPSAAGECNSLASTCQAFFSLSLLSVPIYKGMQSRAWCREGEEDSSWLIGVNTPSSFFILERNTIYFFSSFLHYEGKRRKNGERKKENGAEISNIAKYTSENSKF